MGQVLTRLLSSISRGEEEGEEEEEEEEGPPPRNSLPKMGLLVFFVFHSAFAWFVWEKGYNGKPTIDWI